MELKKYKLGEIARIFNGSTPSTKEPDNYDGDIIWATPKDLSMQNSKYFYKGERNITKKGFESCSTQMIPANNILMSSRAPIGLFAINKVDCCTNQGFKSIVLDKSISDVDFMYYFLKYHVKEIEALGNGTTFKEVSKTSFEKYEINIPPLDTQRKIAGVLSALDDKIALNNKMNANLEEQARTLFKNWFVDFAPFGGKMPSGWKMGKLSDIAEITMGQAPDGKSYNENGIGTVFYQGRAEFGTRFPTRRLFTTDPKRMAKKFDTLMSVRAPIGDLNIANENCCIGRGLAAIRTKDNFQSFIHYTVVFLRNQLNVFNGEGTVFGCINRAALNNMRRLPTS